MFILNDMHKQCEADGGHQWSNDRMANDTSHAKSFFIQKAYLTKVKTFFQKYVYIYLIKYRFFLYIV